MNELSKIYDEDKTIKLLSAEKLYKKVKQSIKTITLKQVKDFLNEKAETQITKKPLKVKEYDTIVSRGLRNNYQMDIMYLPNSRSNKNYKYLLTCIDVYSRYVFVKKLKNKDGNNVFEAIKSLFNEYGKPNNLNVDEGSEFIYKPFIEYCKTNDILLWISDPKQENKNAIIERLHRTLRGLILKYETLNGKAYIQDLDYLIDRYNTSYHNTIKTEPIKIWEGDEKNKQNTIISDITFQVGDKVRYLLKKGLFDKKSSTANYSKRVYTIREINKRSIYLDGGLTKPFRSYELIKAIGGDLNTKLDEKIIKDNKKNTIERRLRREGLD
jgi:putative transposase